MSQRRRSVVSRFLVIIVALGGVALGLALNACSSSTDGTTAACGGAPDYSASIDAGPVNSTTYDTNCYTAPGTAATVISGGGTTGSGGSS